MNRPMNRLMKLINKPSILDGLDVGRGINSAGAQTHTGALAWSVFVVMYIYAR